MSTKTNFKRIALVAVASLGLGVLSSVPSQAVLSSATVTVTNGTGSLATSDSTTAATINVKAFSDAAYDSFTITLGSITTPTGADIKGNLMPVDTSGATTKVSALVLGTVAPMTSYGLTNGDTVTTTGGAAGTISVVKGGTTIAATDSGTASNAYLGLTVDAFLDSQTARTTGTYTGSVVVKFYESGVLVLLKLRLRTSQSPSQQ